MIATDDFVLRLYLRDLERVLPAGEAKFLAVTVTRNGVTAAREHLVLGHLSKVIRMAFDYQGFGLPLGDLISEGNLGLLRAAELFDPLRNVQFSYYARPWIRVQMQRAVSYQAWPVSLPPDFRWRRGQVFGAQERLTARLKRAPADAEVAKECGLKVRTVRRLRSAPVPSFFRLDSPCPSRGNASDDGLTLAEVIPDPHSPTPAEEIARRSDYELLGRFIATLQPGEQRVLRLRYGLEDGCERTLGEVGSILGYCRQGVHRIESVALGKLRQHARFLELTGPARVSKPNGKLNGSSHLGHGRRTLAETLAETLSKSVELDKVQDKVQDKV